MEFNWDDFKGKYQNEQEARQGFVALCEKLMDNKYPDFIIKNSETIKEKDNKKDQSLDKKCKVFLSKYFLDGVSNSRKGQIRKSLNDNLPYMKANKINEWYLLMPLEFSPEEKNWWENWSLRIKQENGITPIAILSDKIIDMIADLKEDFKGTESITRRSPAISIEPEEVAAQDNAEESPENSTSGFQIEVGNDLDKTIAIIASAVTANEQASSETEKETPEDKTEENMLMVQSPSENTTEERNSDSVETIASTEERNADNDNNAEPAAKSKFAKAARPEAIPEPTLNQLEKSWEFKQKFEALEAEKLLLPTDKDNNQRAVFDQRRDVSSVKNYLNDFVFGDMSKFNGTELEKKAKIYVTNQQYSRGLYIYEYANAKNLLNESDLQEKYQKGVSEASYKLTYKYFMILGDLLFAKRDYINACETYEKALNTAREYEDNLSEAVDEYGIEAASGSALIKSDEAESKHLEAKAESLLQIGDFAQATDNFSLALDPDNQNLKKRLELAQYLENGCHFFKKPFQFLNIFRAPYYYFKARAIDPNIKELKKAEKLRNQAIIGLIVSLLIIAAIVWLVLQIQRTATHTADDYNKTEAVMATSPRDIYLSKGDMYMNMISPENPHFIDSAIFAYDHARRFECTDTLAEVGYRKAIIARDNYVAQVQQHISTDSATFFLSMRRPTEGLRLFKYKYDPMDPEKGKFGYVDERGIVKIAPMFDFNYRKMDGTGETFYNGRAKVCLKVADYDTVYFYIDQQGNRIDKMGQETNN